MQNIWTAAGRVRTRRKFSPPSPTASRRCLGLCTGSLEVVHRFQRKIPNCTSFSREAGKASHTPVDLPEGDLRKIPLGDGHRGSNHKRLRSENLAAVIDECVRLSAILLLLTIVPAAREREPNDNGNMLTAVGSTELLNACKLFNDNTAKMNKDKGHSKMARGELSI